MPERLLGTMVVYGYQGRSLESELNLAKGFAVDVLEILPDWRAFPDPSLLKQAVADHGLRIHSAHGCWGGQAIHAARVDLGHTDPQVHRASIDDLKRCIDWLGAAGGTHLVIHPGGLSVPEDRAPRRDALARGMLGLAEHTAGTGVLLCVENMPPGVHPGSHMAELAELLAELNNPGLALALDTGHAHLSADIEGETLAAGSLLATTHVHDNNGRKDSHEPPGEGTIDWPRWGAALDQIDYRGPIMLECIRELRIDPCRFRPDVILPLCGR